jgi:hypothetical protein
VFIFVRTYFVIDSVRKLLLTPSYTAVNHMNAAQCHASRFFTVLRTIVDGFVANHQHLNTRRHTNELLNYYGKWLQNNITI